MSSNLEQELKNMREQLAAELQKGAEANPRQIEFLKGRIQEFEKQVGSLQAEEQSRIERQEQQINELMDYVVSLGIFEYTVGEQPVSGLGLNEYQDRREKFNGILYAVIVEKQKELMDAHNVEMQEKTAKISELKAKCASLEEALEKVMRDCVQVEEANETLMQDNKKLELENETLGNKNIQQLRKITDLESMVNNLQTALENERKAKASAAPSKSLQEQLEEYKKAQQSKYIKVKSKTKLDIAGKEWSIEHLDGTTEKVNGIEQAKYKEATEDEIEEARFQAAKASEEAAENHPTLVEPEPPTFQIPDDIAGMDGVQSAGDIGNHGDQRADGTNAGAEPILWKDWADATIRELQQRVERIERYANIEGAA